MLSSKKIIPLFALLAVAVLPAMLPAQETVLKPAPQKAVPKWWADRYKLLNARAEKGDFDVMFVGDSITQGWEKYGQKVWDEKIAPLSAQNFGIGGDCTENLLWRLKNGNLHKNSNPKVVVMMIGTNNSGHRMDKPEIVAAGIKANIDEIRAKKPKAKILLLAIFPRDAKPTDKRRVNNEAVNALIAKFDDGKHVFFKNINKVFLEPDDTLSKTVMPDLLHLREDGYNRWADAIVPEIKNLL